MLKGLFGKPTFEFPTGEPNAGGQSKLEPPRIDDVTQGIERVLTKPTKEELRAGYEKYLEEELRNEGCTCSAMFFEEWVASRKNSGGGLIAWLLTRL